ncbi:MAG TPA: right-handed parallel beta-helix repeat-containing protein [Polyangiaceae bacterium]|nr:right-handed parallel beta-helix repeat-containing protein [Polyangiaceae bacterium]
MRGLGVLALAVIGCVADTREPPTAPALPACGELELAMPDGSCTRPGIPADGCAEGFVHDGEYACTPVLPGEPCPDGLMAVPGETACRPVMACGAGKWGTIATEVDTEHVDGSYAGTDSDGSEQKPWTTIGDAIIAAAPSAIIAIAEGSYLEDVVVGGKPVRLWGICPERVAIIGQAGFAAVFITTNANQSELHGVSLSGADFGLVLSGSEAITIDRVRVHDTGQRGIDLEDTNGPASATLVDSLVERARDVGVYLGGAELDVERSVVRGTSPRADLTSGHGIQAQLSCTADGCDANARSSVAVSASVVHDNHESGIFLTGSDASIEATVVRNTLPSASDGSLGRGIHIGSSCTPVGCDPATRANASVRGSFIANNYEVGLMVFGSDANVETTVVRDTAPQLSDGRYGSGVSIQAACYETTCSTRSTTTITSSLVMKNREFGVSAMGSDVTVDRTVVRETVHQELSKNFGRGINVQIPCLPLGCRSDMPSRVGVFGSLVEQNDDAGLFIGGSDATVSRTLVRATAARALDEQFGDGIVAISHHAPASAAIDASRVEDSARAGIASFGASLSLAGTHVKCAAFELEGEPFEGHAFVFEDRGDNRCGCPTIDRACVAVGASLAIPESAE